MRTLVVSLKLPILEALHVIRFPVCVAREETLPEITIGQVSNTLIKMAPGHVMPMIIFRPLIGQPAALLLVRIFNAHQQLRHLWYQSTPGSYQTAVFRHIQYLIDQYP